MKHETGRLPRCILIANRGETAVRIARTCHDLGIRSIAIYSQADAGSIHVSACDDAVCLDGLAPGEAYLAGDRIIALAQSCEAEAIHPGYGFLAENAGFAHACRDAGLTFIGPHPDIVARLGDKIAAKEIADAANVPTVPGITDLPDADSDSNRDRRLIEAAASLPFPLLVKASSGGGGRGMRIVDKPSQLADAITQARSEAQSSFGSDRLLVERYIANPRHVEVQIFGDQHGNVLHLLERDCTIQRRHQKLIEEAPAPALAENTRKALHEAAYRLARATNYDNAGTVEFVLDAETQDFFFLEVNTRLQVEHPVTEAILGLDLVAWQIRVAAGQPLALKQDDIRADGWAIEARITAEDPSDDFRPQTGRLVRFVPPEGIDIRFDSGVVEGSEVTPYYDSMLAKVIAHGPDRDTARRQLNRALGDMRTLGLSNNIAFLRHVLTEQTFETAGHTTHLAGTLASELNHANTSLQDGARLHAAAAVALCGQAQSPGSCSPWSSLGNWRAGGREAWSPRRPVVLRDEADSVHRYWVSVDDHRITLQPIGRDAAGPQSFAFSRSGDQLMFNATNDRQTFTFHIDKSDSNAAKVYIESHRGAHRLICLTGLQAWRQSHDTASEGDRLVRAAGPGLVVSVTVNIGDAVEAGTPLLTIESMKMLTTITSKCAGLVASIECVPGQAVAKGNLLVELETATQEED